MKAGKAGISPHQWTGAQQQSLRVCCPSFAEFSGLFIYQRKMGFLVDEF